ncbi:MAG: PhnD/SsuA/transferrin family substrate-binding protein [Johnsonella sp.]|nr:PhnD/SsuA/transferrin family substrate-binding protein [Johnsonella sp.]
MMKKQIGALMLAASLLLGACSTGSGSAGSTASQESAKESTEAKMQEAASMQESNAESKAEESAPAQMEGIRLGALKGPTSMGMVKLLSDDQSTEAAGRYAFTLAASPDEIVPKIVKGELDIAAVPSNLASVLYNKTEGKVKVLAINTLGVLYLCRKGSAQIESIEDLKGKTIYAGGKGATPEYVLSYILSQHGLDIEKDVKMEWKSEHAEIISALANEEEGFALLPQPFVTVAASQIENFEPVLDMTKEWDALNNGSRLITGVLVGRTEFIEKNKEALDSFMEEYQASTQWVNANLDEAAQLIEKYDIIKAPIAKKALPHCNITYIEGEEMEKALSGYLEILHGLKPEAVGGKLPESDFYFKK